MITDNTDRDRYFKRFWDSECYDPSPDFKERDMVNNPDHYTTGEIECIDAMAACSSEEEFRGHLKLTAFKYVWRTGKKWNTTEDIDKAIWYLTRLKETYNG